MSKRDELTEFPLYQKAEEIFKITHGLIKIIPADNEFLQETTVRFMMENAMIIPAKIAEAQAVGSYWNEFQPRRIHERNRRYYVGS